MPRLPDHFDLWVRRARAAAEVDRQADYVLGALAALPAWHFFNRGTAEKPCAVEAELEAGRYLILFTDVDRLLDLTATLDAPPVISIPVSGAFTWCLEHAECVGLLVNPGEDAFIVGMDRLKAFYEEWRKHSGGTGYWIPNMTSEEEDFWQEHGL